MRARVSQLIRSASIAGLTCVPDGCFVAAVSSDTMWSTSLREINRIVGMISYVRDKALENSATDSALDTLADSVLARYSPEGRPGANAKPLIALADAYARKPARWNQ